MLSITVHLAMGRRARGRRFRSCTMVPLTLRVRLIDTTDSKCEPRNSN